MAAEGKSKSIVEDYIAKTREETKKALLDSLGLYVNEREYAPDDYDPRAYYSPVYTKYDLIDGAKRYYRETKKSYPDIDEATFEELQRIIREKNEFSLKSPVIEETKEHLSWEFGIESTNHEYHSFAATFMTVIAWVLWIGGIVVAILSARVEKLISVYQRETVFEWLTFFTVLIPYFVGGCFALCMSELFKNISAIANRVAGYIVSETKKTK